MGTSDIRAPAAVLWDMDGTLIDSEGLWADAAAELLEHLGGRMTEQIRVSLVGTSGRSAMPMLLAAANRPVTDDAVDMAREFVIERMREFLARPLPWRPGAADALRSVRAAGFPSALVTTTRRSLVERCLDTIGRSFFDVVVCGDEVDGRTKPDPWPYRLAARRLGVDPAACLAVEDSEIGAAAAAGAGCAVLVVPGQAPVARGPRRMILRNLVGVDASYVVEVFGELATEGS